MNRSMQDFLQAIDAREGPVSSSATDYPPGWLIEPHSHAKHQLIYAISGVMVVHSQRNQWVVPPNRGIWMPRGQVHSLRCIGSVQMRSVFVQPDASAALPGQTVAVAVSALLRELIQACVAITAPCSPDSREARVMGLILDELTTLPTLPLSLPQPSDPRIAKVCATLRDEPGDTTTLQDWSARLQLDAKTIQRLFQRDTGMTFGQWRQQARLLLALERLALGGKVIDIASELGYDSPSAFTHMFKKQFGTTPSQFFR